MSYVFKEQGAHENNNNNERKGKRKQNKQKQHAYTNSEQQTKNKSRQLVAGDRVLTINGIEPDGPIEAAIVEKRFFLFETFFIALISSISS